MSELAQRPRLSRAARLRLDHQTGKFVLLSPERGLVLNASAALILQRCDAELSVSQLLGVVQAEHASATLSDVLDLLLALERRGLVVFEQVA